MKVIRIIGKVLSIAFTAVLAFILFANVYALIVRSTTDEKQPAVFGWSWAVVISGSMEPYIHVNDLIVVHEEDEYFVGQDVAFYSGNSVVTHRVIEKHDDHYVTQGTANNTEDDPIVPESIIGRVVFVIPYFGVVIEWLRTPIGMLTLLCVGALLFELPNIIEYVKKLISRTEGE